YQAIGSPAGGGWPLSMFLTPDGKPFAGGTYFPPEDQHDEQGELIGVGFLTVLKRIDTLWRDDRDGLEQNAEILTQHVRRTMQPGLALQPVELSPALVTATAAAVRETYDAEHGGLDYSEDQPHPSKFPVPTKLGFLQHLTKHRSDEVAQQMLDHTLRRIAMGGIRDHLGGGFHRYSTDREWHVPHFEKMLYDQAQLLDVYAAAWERTADPLYREVAQGVAEFVRREMTDPRGGFHSALDAETDGVEGRYYVWSKEDVENILGPDDAPLFMRVYGMNEEQVFEHGYVLHLPKPLDEVAKHMNLSREELDRRLEPMRQKLLAARQERPALLKDDKV
ncbi:MAG: thioredoxin domain-containing protein, partial [Planctomycetaceae bacterium]